MEDILAIILIFGGGTVAALSFSPLGRALADRIRGTAGHADPELVAELEELRLEMIEVQERLDFTERMIADNRPQAPALGGVLDEEPT
jgi:hypothetical protein